ncbi:hypothetical protein D3C72_1981090 [compost metagenome]
MVFEVFRLENSWENLPGYMRERIQKIGHDRRLLKRLEELHHEPTEEQDGNK